MKLDGLMPQICEAAAQAVYRYAEVSHEDPSDRGSAPESFITAFVFDRLGSQVTMALESNSKKLVHWNREIHEMRSKASRPKDENAIKKAVQQLTRRRIDLVIFDSSDDHWSFAGVVEFKRYDIPKVAKDRAKLLELLAHLDTCPAGAVCCLTNAPSISDFIQTQKRESERVGDHWYCHDVPELPHGIETRLSIFARVFGPAPPAL